MEKHVGLGTHPLDFVSDDLNGTYRDTGTIQPVRHNTGSPAVPESRLTSATSITTTPNNHITHSTRRLPTSHPPPSPSFFALCAGRCTYYYYIVAHIVLSRRILRNAFKQQYSVFDSPDKFQPACRHISNKERILRLSASLLLDRSSIGGSACKKQRWCCGETKLSGVSPLYTRRAKGVTFHQNGAKCYDLLESSSECLWLCTYHAKETNLKRKYIAPMSVRRTFY